GRAERAPAAAGALRRDAGTWQPGSDVPLVDPGIAHQASRAGSAPSPHGRARGRSADTAAGRGASAYSKGVNDTLDGRGFEARYRELVASLGVATGLSNQGSVECVGCRA